MNSIVGVDRENLVGSKAKIFKSNERTETPLKIFRGRVQRPGLVIREKMSQEFQRLQRSKEMISKLKRHSKIDFYLQGWDSPKNNDKLWQIENENREYENLEF